MKRVGEWLEINILENWANNTIFHVLTKELGASKALVQKWNQAKSIRKNDQQADVNHRLQVNDCLSLHLFIKEDYSVIPEQHPIEVLYEDDHMLIVNKQAGIDTHPNAPGQTGTLANGIAYYYQLNDEQLKVRHIHRLDKDTSGAIIFAKHDLSHTLLDKALEQRQIKRTYIAVAEGKLSQAKGTIDKPIGKDRHHATRRRISPTGQKAITHFQVKQYIPDQQLSIVELRLDTGRTHQIRVHLSSIGHPIIGDVLYGAKKRILNRQALHAAKVTLPHPLTGEKVEIEADFPKDMLPFLRK
ncbi:hypothetical protein WQ54_14055 [Bacillus sp. SA1-12]|uniref:RluA family pseudouridine synthase n=1 Tax=Bacillus sp. SA1-12 TaxID=1455638 RepID=UPI000624FFE2|nr:RluA family pseudouridine synthase [Bacillus sp. SA1-12]KKI91518.1 hypothetical protein WQ54_14055 [Bacillus sp. SA1-12]